MSLQYTPFPNPRIPFPPSILTSPPRCHQSDSPLLQFFLPPPIMAAAHATPPSPAGPLRFRGGERGRPLSSPTSFPVTDPRARRGGQNLVSSPQPSGAPLSVPLRAPATAVRPWEEDVERVLWTAAEIAARVTELAAEVSGDLGASGAPVAVVGVATGAFVFLADLVRGMAIPVTVDLVRVESYGSRAESSGAPTIVSDVKLDVVGKHVILVEDIVDTGNTLSFLVSHMKSKGASSVSVCTFLDKSVRRKVHFELQGDGKFYRGFECPDYFVVGYGMDFSERYRNMPFVGILKPESYPL